MQTQVRSSQAVNSKTQQKRQMHRYIWVCVGVFISFLATFPLAYWRVSNSDKYDGLPFNSFNWEDSQKANFK